MLPHLFLTENPPTLSPNGPSPGETGAVTGIKQMRCVAAMFDQPQTAAVIFHTDEQTRGGFSPLI